MIHCKSLALISDVLRGKTSDFSEELCVKVIGTSVVECGSADNGNESGDGSSGDGGNDGSAENDADGGSSGGESHGSAEIGAGSGSGGGCFIAASSFVFRGSVLP
jgi:hypothetical protein